VTDRVSIADAAERIRKEFGRLDVMVQNAAISNTRKGSLSLQDYARISRASNASLDEVRTVWETNGFGVLAVYQAIVPLLRESSRDLSRLSCFYALRRVSGWTFNVAHHPACRGSQPSYRSDN
jgi:NAD(P)-dependent dehydrogenase (short-subunit alcohol dehydrogenase family)